MRDDCLDFAIANGEKFGIWGGMSERERRRVRRSRLGLQQDVGAAS
ncbi:MAG: WhiB family transcriptional regulator [Acidimicrobiales bacterium]